MIKKYLAALGVLCLGTVLNAQTFICSPSNTVIEPAPLNTYSNFNIDMVNQTTDTMTLAWDLLVNTLDANWDYSLCDYTACYTVLPTSGVMSPNYSSNSFLKLTLNPLNTRAAGELKFWVYDVNNPSSGDTVLFSVSSLTVGLFENHGSELLVYPNPASSFLNLGKQVSAVEIFDLAGQMVLSTSATSANDRVEVHTLNSGVYMVNLQLQDGSTHIRRVVIEK